MTQTALVDVELEESNNSDDNDTPTGRIKAAVTDTGARVIQATVEVSGQDAFHAEKETSSMSGMATFLEVPIQEYTITISADGYQTKTVEITASDFEEN